MGGEGFEIIEPEHQTVNFRGREIQVYPITIGQLPAFSRAVAEFSHLFTSEDDDDVTALLSQCPEPIIKAVSVATGIDIDELNKGYIDDLVLLVSAVLRVNKNFFIEKVRPAIMDAVAALNQNEHEDSTTQSNG